ncbi:bifunctional phosphoribosylaminoimidazolecarboxamide formyltransferase/IMP cyclohydrolase [Neisseriaceae bacterium ESL0693]|nr:bifunctional phosphoribosylaminoimidazolecarboxamide formyltransferase/IMP cyclohydrolase [Neisseriaceae bacterium ESL0693]
MTVVKRALLSVSDKTGIVEFAKALAQLDIEILSTGGTAQLLAQSGIDVVEVADYTGFPEMLDGRVKTLHPRIHAGILSRRDDERHVKEMQQQDLGYIDLVCVNLYPFADTVANPDCTLAEAIENIDIGGPTMIRAAAKNWRDVAVITNHADYAAIIQELQTQQGVLSQDRCFELACQAFTHTAQYDAMIANYLTRVETHHLDQAVSLNPFARQLNQGWVKVQDLRYGENPHQKAAFYRDVQPAPGSLASYQQLQGKALSYNNIADADAAWEAVKAFQMPACVIVKHANPCGVAVANEVLTAYQRAFATDPTSAFGGIVAFNRQVDAATAKAVVTQQFLEVMIAPAFTEEARTVLSQKKNVRVLEIALLAGANDLELKRIGGGLLVQTPDTHQMTLAQLEMVTQRQPTAQQLQDLLFLWQVAKYVKSNAIVFGVDGQTCGIGAGQMSRVDSTRIAAAKARDNGFDLSGACAASDAFFPFRDGVDVIAEQGIKAIIQPGGSIRDDEVIAAADEHDIAMVLTHIRHFRH